MTITIGFSTVADSISKLSVTGITMLDIDKVPDSAQMLCPVMFPQPDNFVTNINVERVTVGSGGTAKMDMTYTLNYVFLQSEIGSGISAFGAYSSIIANIATIMGVILTNDNITGAVDLTLNSIGEIGAVEDPSGNQYWGVLFSFKVLEFIQ